MKTVSKSRTTLRNVNPHDDWLRVTGQADAHDLARFLQHQRPDSFAWEEGSATTRYARSLRADGGVSLAYARRNRDGLNAPQSDSRDSRDFMLEVPGHHARDLLPILRTHATARTMQCPRRDLAVTARFDPADCSQIYRTWADLLASELRRPCYRLGPDGADWESVSLQTHPRQSAAPRFAILYDKHAHDAEQYPDPGTLRFEFRWQPDKQHQKRALFESDALPVLFSWRLSMKAVELLLNAPQSRSFAWTKPRPDADLETMTRRLLESYGPTIARGLHKPGYLETLALAALLQANNNPRPDVVTTRSPVCPEVDYAAPRVVELEAKASGYH
jgi:hypothetical protein